MSAQQPFPAEGPDEPAYTGEPAGDDAGQDQGEDAGPGAGEVSEVQRLDRDNAGTPISPGDSTAGYPASESGDPNTQGSGPDAKPPENRRDNDMKPDDGQLGQSVEDESL